MAPKVDIGQSLTDQRGAERDNHLGQPESFLFKLVEIFQVNGTLMLQSVHSGCLQYLAPVPLNDQDVILF